MTGKHFNWHKAWARDAQGHLVHTSGLRYMLTHGYGFSDLVTADASVAIFQASRTPRGVPVHQFVEGVQSLAKEAQRFQERDP